MKYSEELAVKIAAELAGGKSMRAICRMDNMPALVTVYDWRRKYPEFDKLLQRAKEDQADSLFDEIAETVQKLDQEGLSMAEVSAIREKLHALQWCAARLKPQAYGQAKQDAAAITSYVDALRQINQEEGRRAKPRKKQSTTRASTVRQEPNKPPVTH